jgi:hypothetical protein
MIIKTNQEQKEQNEDRTRETCACVISLSTASVLDFTTILYDTDHSSERDMHKLQSQLNGEHTRFDDDT